MIRHLLATTAIAALMTTGALAAEKADTAATDTANPPAATEQAAGSGNYFQATKGQALASSLIGESVYSGTGDDAETIGDVNDIVLSPEGQAKAVVIGVGGFLGIGEKDVAVNFDQLSWVEREGGNWLVVETSKDALKAAPEFDRTVLLPEPPAQDTAMAPAPTAPATGGSMATEDTASNDNAATAPAAEDQTAMDENKPKDDAAGSMAAEDTASNDDAAAKPADDQTAMDENKPKDDAAGGMAAEDTASNDDAAMKPADDQTAMDENKPKDDAAGGMAAEDTASNDDAAMKPADDTAMNADEANPDDTTTAAVPSQDNMSAVDVGTLSADEIIGTTVYGANDENLGEIGDVIVGKDGAKVNAYIVDVGGFLGIGEKPVALDAASLKIMKDENGAMYIYTPFTEDQLKQQAAYSEDQYKENPDSVILR